MVNWRYVLVVVAVVVAVVGYFLVVTPPATAMRAPRQPDWQNVVDDPARPLLINLSSGGTAKPGSYPQRLVEQAFNIRFKLQNVSSAEAYVTQLPLRLAAGNVPDLFSPGSADMLRTYAKHGFLMPLPLDVLRKYAPHVVQTVNELAPESWPNTTHDGVNYGIPGIWYDGIFPRTPLWRSDWLRNVGISEVPQTLDQMHEALHRFRYNDPDRNGVQDTWGMSGDLLAWYTTFTEIFGAYGVLPFDWMQRDGVVVWGGTLPETRQALELLRAWYQEGLIHPDFVTDRWASEVPQKLYSGRIGYVNYMSSYEAFDASNPGSTLSMLRKLAPDAEVVPGVPPIGPTGHRGMRVWSAGSGPIAFGRQMTDRPEAVIRLLKMYDRLASDKDLYIRTRLGEPGVNWRFRDPSQGAAGGVEVVPPFDQKDMREENGLSPPMFVATASTFGGIGGRPELFLDYYPPGLVRFQTEHRNPAWGRKDLFGRPDAIPEANDFLSDLVQLQQTTFAKIIRGQEPIEAFDRFVERWHKQGGDRLLARAQQYFALQQQMLVEAGASIKN